MLKYLDYVKGVLINDGTLKAQTQFSSSGPRLAVRELLASMSFYKQNTYKGGTACKMICKPHKPAFYS